MSKAHIITNWIGDGLTPKTAFRPAVPENVRAATVQSPNIGYPEIDNGNIPASPNVIVIEIVCESAVIDNYDAANPGAVIWRNPIPGPNEVPSPARRGQMINRLKALGVPAAEAAQLVGGNPNTTAGQIGKNIAAYVSTRPHGKAAGKGNP